MNTYIYLLTDGIYYYIGKSDNPERRYTSHINDAFNPKSKSYSSLKDQWVRSFDFPKEHILMRIIETIPIILWEERERYWIDYYRIYYGHRYILNMSDGGDQPPVGEEHHLCEVSDEKIIWAANQYSLGLYNIRELAHKLNMSRSGLNQIFLGINRSYLNLDIKSPLLKTDLAVEYYIEQGFTLTKTAELLSITTKVLRTLLRRRGFKGPWRNN